MPETSCQDQDLAHEMTARMDAQPVVRPRRYEARIEYACGCRGVCTVHATSRNEAIKFMRAEAAEKCPACADDAAGRCGVLQR